MWGHSRSHTDMSTGSSEDTSAVVLYHPLCVWGSTQHCQRGQRGPHVPARAPALPQVGTQQHLLQSDSYNYQFLQCIFCIHCTQMSSCVFVQSSGFLLPALPERFGYRAMVSSSAGTMLLLLLFGLADVPLARLTTAWNQTPQPHPLGKPHISVALAKQEISEGGGSAVITCEIFINLWLLMTHCVCYYRHFPSPLTQIPLLILRGCQLWCLKEIRAAPWGGEWLGLF